MSSSRRRKRNRGRRRTLSRGKRLGFSAYLKQIRQLIAEHGHAVQAVFPRSGDEPGWAYTIGLHARGLPELIVIGGLSIPDQHSLLNELAARMRSGEKFVPGRSYASLLVGADLSFVEVANTASEEFAVANRLQAEFRALQVVWPDQDNRLPWDPGCDIPRSHQRLLGPPPMG